MRITYAGLLFALSVLAAACAGGGGSSNVLPSGPNNGPTNGPPSTPGTSTRAAMTFYIPPPNRQASRKPLYISPGTQSFGVLAVSVSSSETPTPLNLQIFPATTPSPCVAASGGGETCTFNVVAPVGQDIFYVAAFATASPGANAIPLSELASGTVTVSLSPSPGASPLAFTLNGVVNTVTITVPSPDPGNTPNTEVFTAASPSSALALGITAHDSAGNVIVADPTTKFEVPVVVSVNPATAGIGLQLTSTCPSPAPAITRPRRANVFGTGSAAVVITCAADVNNVSFGYDGTPHPDASDHLIDTVAISATQMQSPGPSPAAAVIQSNVVSYQIPIGGHTPHTANLLPLPNGGLLYLVTVSPTTGPAGLIGTYSPSTNTLSAPAILSTAVAPANMALAPNGAFLVLDGISAIDCWTTTASALSGAAPANTFAIPPDPSLNPVYAYGLAIDSANNGWLTGYDSSTGQTYAAYFAVSSTCATPTIAAGNFVTVTGDTYDTSTFLAPLPSGGIALNSHSNGTAYAITTSGVSGPFTPALGAGVTPGGAGVGANGTIYQMFYNYVTGGGDLESAPSSGGPLTSVLNLTPQGLAYAGPAPGGLSVFSLNGVGDRIAYTDLNYTAFGLIGNLSTTPTTMLTSLPNEPGPLYKTAFDGSGGAFVIYEGSGPSVWLARTFLTKTWNVPVTSMFSYQLCSSELGLLSIDQRAPSAGPFTITAAGVTSSPMPGNYNDWVITPPNSSPFTLTVTDAGGRTETYPNVSVAPNPSCP